MFRALAGYIFGSASNEPSSVECETKEVDDWTIVNTPDAKKEDVDVVDGASEDVDLVEESLEDVDLVEASGEADDQVDMEDSNEFEGYDLRGLIPEDEESRIMAQIKSEFASYSNSSLFDTESRKKAVKSDVSGLNLVENHFVMNSETDRIDYEWLYDSELRKSGNTSDSDLDEEIETLIAKVPGNSNFSEMVKVCVPEYCCPAYKRVTQLRNRALIRAFGKPNSPNPRELEIYKCLMRDQHHTCNLADRTSVGFYGQRIKPIKKDESDSNLDEARANVERLLKGRLAARQYPVMPNAVVEARKSKRKQKGAGRKITKVLSAPYSPSDFIQKTDAVSKTDLLQRIKELEPEQRASERADKAHITKGQLDRHNKNYIYHNSTRENRRKNFQKKHSGANNNRGKC